MKEPFSGTIRMVCSIPIEDNLILILNAIRIE